MISFDKTTNVEFNGVQNQKLLLLHLKDIIYSFKIKNIIFHSKEH